MGGVQSLALQAWLPASSRATDLGAHLPGLQVSAGAAYPVFTVQGLEGVGAQEATAAAVNSLNSL